MVTTPPRRAELSGIRLEFIYRARSSGCFHERLLPPPKMTSAPHQTGRARRPCLGNVDNQFNVPAYPLQDVLFASFGLGATRLRGRIHPPLHQPRATIGYPGPPNHAARPWSTFPFARCRGSFWSVEDFFVVAAGLEHVTPFATCFMPGFCVASRTWSFAMLTMAVLPAYRPTDKKLSAGPLFSFFFWCGFFTDTARRSKPPHLRRWAEAANAAGCYGENAALGLVLADGPLRVPHMRDTETARRFW